MEKKYLALLAAVAVIGAVAFVPANVAGVDAVEEEDKIEILLSDLIPNLFIGIGSILGIGINLDLGNYFVDLEELVLGVEEVDLSLVLYLLGIDMDLIGLRVPNFIITLLPPALELTIGLLNILIISIPWEEFTLSLSSLPPSIFAYLDSLGLVSVFVSILSMMYIGYLIFWLPYVIDFPLSIMFSVDAEGMAFSINLAIELILGLIELDPIPPLGFEIEWPW